MTLFLDDRGRDMGTQPVLNKSTAMDNPIVQSIIEQILKEIGQQIKPEVIVPALIKAFLGLFHKKPKDPVLVPPTPIVVNVPTPIPAPSASTPEPGQIARQIARVRLRIQKAEKPDMSTPERLQDPGNLYDNPMGMVESGSAFNYGSAFWLDLTAFDENGDEWQGESIIAANKEFKTEHRIYENGQLIAFIKGEGDDNPTAQGEPKPWEQQNSEQITWAQRAWKDSVGRNARVRLGREGTFHVVGYLDGVKSDEFDIRVS